MSNLSSKVVAGVSLVVGFVIGYITRHFFKSDLDTNSDIDIYEPCQGTKKKVASYTPTRLANVTPSPADTPSAILLYYPNRIFQRVEQLEVTDRVNKNVLHMYSKKSLVMPADLLYTATISTIPTMTSQTDLPVVDLDLPMVQPEETPAQVAVNNLTVQPVDTQEQADVNHPTAHLPQDHPALQDDTQKSSTSSVDLDQSELQDQQGICQVQQSQLNVTEQILLTAQQLNMSYQNELTRVSQCQQLLVTDPTCIPQEEDFNVLPESENHGESVNHADTTLEKIPDQPATNVPNVDPLMTTNDTAVIEQIESSGVDITNNTPEPDHSNNPIILLAQQKTQE